MNMSDEFGEEEKALSRDIIAIAKERNMVMEVNGSGIMKTRQRGLKESRYPRREFWEMAKDAGLCCIVSADAHDPVSMGQRLELAQAFASSLLKIRVSFYQLSSVRPSPAVHPLFCPLLSG